jgi:hypothetical protein
MKKNLLSSKIIASCALAFLVLPAGTALAQT